MGKSLQLTIYSLLVYVLCLVRPSSGYNRLTFNSNNVAAIYVSERMSDTLIETQATLDYDESLTYVVVGNAIDLSEGVSTTVVFKEVTCSGLSHQISFLLIGTVILVSDDTSPFLTSSMAYGALTLPIILWRKPRSVLAYNAYQSSSISWVGQGGLTVTLSTGSTPPARLGAWSFSAAHSISCGSQACTYNFNVFLESQPDSCSSAVTPDVVNICTGTQTYGYYGSNYIQCGFGLLLNGVPSQSIYLGDPGIYYPSQCDNEPLPWGGSNIAGYGGLCENSNGCVTCTGSMLGTIIPLADTCLPEWHFTYGFQSELGSLGYTSIFNTIVWAPGPYTNPDTAVASLTRAKYYVVNVDTSFGTYGAFLGVAGIHVSDYDCSLPYPIVACVWDYPTLPTCPDCASSEQHHCYILGLASTPGYSLTIEDLYAVDTGNFPDRLDSNSAIEDTMTCGNYEYHTIVGLMYQSGGWTVGNVCAMDSMSSCALTGAEDGYIILGTGNPCLMQSEDLSKCAEMPNGATLSSLPSLADAVFDSVCEDPRTGVVRQLKDYKLTKSRKGKRQSVFWMVVPFIILAILVCTSVLVYLLYL